MTVTKWDPIAAEKAQTDQQASQITEAQIADIVAWTLGSIKEKGYCLWACGALDNAVICVVEKVSPALDYEGYPVFTLDELAILSNSKSRSKKYPLWIERMVIEAKKVGGPGVVVLRQNVDGRKMKIERGNE